MVVDMTRKSVPRSNWDVFWMAFPLSWLGGLVLFLAIGFTFFQALLAGLFFGVVFGTVMASSLHLERMELEVPDVVEFRKRLKHRLAELHYHKQSEDEDLTVFTIPMRWGGLAASKITVSFENGKAMIIGPRRYLNKLEDALLQDHALR